MAYVNLIIWFLILEVLGIFADTNSFISPESDDKVTAFVMNELAELRDNQGKQSEQLQALNTELAAVNNRLHSTESELCQWKQKFTSVENELNDANQRIKDTELELKYLNKQVQVNNEITNVGDVPKTNPGVLSRDKAIAVTPTNNNKDVRLFDLNNNKRPPNTNNGDLLRDQNNSKRLPKTNAGKRLHEGNFGTPRTHIRHADMFHHKRQPYNGVAFSAALSTFSIKLGTQETIIYDRVITNTENAYDPLTGMFKAPGDGVYAFYQNYLEDPGAVMALDIIVNGKSVSRSYNDASKNMFNMSGNFVILKLESGERVGVRSEHAGSLHGENYTSFSGFLLYDI